MPESPGNRKPPELMAPAGDMASLKAAVDAGADAVYLGVGELNMRLPARSFSPEDLPAVSALCRRHQVQLYITLNTILFDHDLESVRDLVREAGKYADAVICWDPAVIAECRRQGVPFHISTQASVANRASAEFYRDLGAQRLVLARECTLEEIAAIREATGIEVEVFAHGAMCVSISGRCFLSELVHGKSGNRGQCYQNCRREYRVLADDGVGEFRVGNGYIMSAKDLCTIPFLDQVLDVGVDALKLEGRNRPAEYVATTVDAYRQAIDAWSRGTLDSNLKDQLVKQCRQVFNRGFSDGFFMGRPIEEFTDAAGSQAELQKDHVGKIDNYYRKSAVAKIHVQNHGFAMGDRLLVTGPTSGAVEIEVTDLRQEEIPASKAHRGYVTVPCARKVRANDMVYRLTPRAERESIDES